ncbi:zinc-binding dehydrogenase family oxidoreductase (macronuclear) [Tetrahymena thermophila SB210]|uniref:Zinc-binding dehydrogenase family oxidoreductase n=1 Tax=Tetrahymena thermophila (strain SB210) TaxID=312017 RepID=I7M5W1_TETTS|nr:zinc-binding dehydrogenase family oxidoreductase [Tetrahymena thermophila SB210]EAR83313.1 zinc-binding dehydrogenase family oxidoreductase [Tetrahymena thermophila SB210]|eukprot:XP_001030976.1 zinc-binding dehydrogenase family oxidoreductase [Tetrahymena thermophila SB210]
MDNIPQGDQQYYYYKVPQKQSEREKHIFTISEDSKHNFIHSQRIIQQHSDKNKLNWQVTSYDFQEQLSNNEYKMNYQNQVQLDQEIWSSQRTYEEYVKRFVPVCQERFGTNVRVDVTSGEMKQYWSSFVRMTILEKILSQIIQQSRNKDIFIILFMRAQEVAIFTELKNNFANLNARCDIFFVNIGNYNLKKHLSFASALQKNYSTEQLNHKICYAFEQYYSGKDLEQYQDNQYYYIQQVVSEIIPQLNIQEVVNVQAEVQQYPWSQPSKKVIRGTYVVSKENYGDQIQLQDNPNEFIFKERNLDVDDMIDIFSTWINDLLVRYGQDQIEKNTIEKAIEFLTNYMDKIVNQINITNIPIDKPIQNMTVRQRLIAQQSNRVRYNLIVLIKSLSNLLTKDTVGNLNGEEESERIKIGTEIGKFHQRALVMRGLDVETFIKMKNFFIDELLMVKSSIHQESDQERSIFSLENMKDVFLQEDMVDGLKEVKSQYHLISAFPLIGLGVKLQRSDGSMINPYLVQIVDIARINANVDTISIQNTPDKELNLNAGFYLGAEGGTRSYFEQKHGYKPLKWTEYQPKKQLVQELNQYQLFYYKSEQLKEKIDAVVPLFGPKDYDLKPLLATSFFHVLMNFNVMHNVDTCYSEAYLALLSNLLIFLLNQEQSTYINELLDKIYHSIEIVYGDRPFFKTYCEMLLNQPRQAMITYHEGHPTQCQDPSKALAALFYLYKKDQIKDKNKIKQILEAILQEIVSRNIKNLEKLHTYFGIVNYDMSELQKIESNVIEQVVGDVKQYPSVRTVMSVVETALKEKNYFEFTKKCKIYIHKDSFNFMNYGKLNFFTSMKAICNYFLPSEKFSGGLLWIWLLHAQKYPNNYDRNTSEVEENIYKVYSNIKKQKSIYFIKEESLKIYNNCYKILKQKYQEEMFSLHQEATPLIQKQIDYLLNEENKFNISFNNASNLARNCCLSPKCPFYLKKMPNVAEHIKDIDCVIPAFHKTVKIMKGRDAESIFNAICKGTHLEHHNQLELIKLAHRLQSERVQYFLLHKKKDHYINLIEKLLEEYKVIHTNKV